MNKVPHCTTPCASTTAQDATAASAYTLGQVAQGIPCCVPKPHLHINNLSVAYGDHCVLENVSLDIYKGCITALIGPSGCGKSSFLACLNRLTDMIPNAKVSGTILFDGKDILSPAADVMQLRRRIGMIFQKPNPFPLSIYKNLALPLREHSFGNRSDIDTRIEQVLTDVGLWHEVKDRLHTSALTLSGGQQQRLCIARALTLQPDILIMDEPCSALDPLSSTVVEEMINKLKGKYTIVIVTHNLAQARRLANYAAFFWMKEKVGKLIEFGQCHPLFESPKDPLTAAYVAGIAG
jgi:phosphate transport system ATP-binding protein